MTDVLFLQNFKLNQMVLQFLPFLFQPTFYHHKVREVFKKKNVYKAVRLTAWVDPPSPSPEAVRKM